MFAKIRKQILDATEGGADEENLFAWMPGWGQQQKRT